MFVTAATQDMTCCRHITDPTYLPPPLPHSGLYCSTLASFVLGKEKAKQSILQPVQHLVYKE